MKQLSILSLAILYSLISFSQVVEIPDENFSIWLNQNFPSCMNGNLMDTTCEDITEYTYVNCQNKDIDDFTGLEHFTSMISLNINGNDATILPDLSGLSSLNDIEASQCNLTGVIQIPPTLTLLHIGNNTELEGISILPEGMLTLQIYGCTSLIDLPPFPSTLSWFDRRDTPQLNLDISNSNIVTYYAENCNLIEFPEIPQTCITLGISDNSIGNQTSFPSQLETLRINDTEMSELPELPVNLKNLLVDNNSLMEMPELPSGLEQLFINFNPITSIDLVPSITYFSASQCGLEIINGSLPYCSDFIVPGNNLFEIPNLPESFMTTLMINDNPIACLNELPNTIGQSFFLNGTNITCLPSLPDVNFTDVDDFESFSICQNDDLVNNPNGCPSVTGFEGYIYLDEDSQCDFNEMSLANIPVRINQNGTEIATTSSLSNGRYFHSNALGEYEADLDFSNSPFVNYCGANTVLLDNNQPFVTGVNLSLGCEFGYDFGVQSILTDGWVFPGQIHTVSISAGEISQFYNANCSGSSAGEVLVSLDGPGFIQSVPVDYPEPIEMTDSTALFSIDDFTAITLMDQFQLNIFTLTTATNQDELCLTVEVTSEEVDENLDNNTLSLCYPVVNSYDPNNKLVSPMTVEPGFNDWLYYTINFQNTGDAPAFNIRLEDELANNLDLETFQMTNSSHDSYYELENQNLKVFYPNIMLADSTTNEPESKGFFQFRIHTLNSLPAGETLENFAGIYFDFNDPIITNTAVTTAVLPDHIGELSSTNVSVYPNPSNGVVQLRTSEAISAISCYNLLGEEILFVEKTTGSASRLTIEGYKGIVLIAVETASGISRKRVVLE